MQVFILQALRNNDEIREISQGNWFLCSKERILPFSHDQFSYVLLNPTDLETIYRMSDNSIEVLLWVLVESSL
jgi:hypothetical protein